MLLLPFALLSTAVGLIESFPIDLDGKDTFSVIWSFEFAAGGQFDITLSLLKNPPASNTSLQFLLCNDDQMDILRNSRFQDVCSNEVFDYLAPEKQMSLSPQYGMVHSWHMVVAERSWLRLLQLNCHEESWRVQADLVAMNPGGEYLSMSEVPYKMTFLVCAIAWAVLLLLWFANWIPYRYFNVKLQRILSLVPVVYIAYSIVQLMSWKEKSLTGREGPDYLTWLVFLFGCLATGAVFGTLIVVSKGVGIIKAKLGAVAARRVWALIIVLVVTSGVYETYEGFLLFILVIVYVLILRFIFASIVENLSILNSQLAIVRTMDVNVATTPVATKIKMYKRFQLTMVIFLAVDVIFQLWASIFLRSTPWVRDAIENGILITMVSVVYITFRLRPFVPFAYRVLGYEEAENFEQTRERGASRELPLMMDIGTGVWRPGRPYPSLAPDANLQSVNRENNPIYLVTNPSKNSGGVMVAKLVYERPKPSVLPESV